MKNKFMKAVFTGLVLCGVCLQANATIIGNDVIDRTYVDTASNINFVDNTLVITVDGVINSWDIWSGRSASEFSLQVLRGTGTPNEYLLVGENYFAGAGALGAVNLAVPTIDQIEVQAGDVIGWWFGNGRGVIDFSSASDTVNWKYEGAHVDVGDTIAFATGGAREYSISANVTAVSAPSVAAIFALGLFAMAYNRKRNAL